MKSERAVRERRQRRGAPGQVGVDDEAFDPPSLPSAAPASPIRRSPPRSVLFSGPNVTPMH
jgi:hypothetical protein